MQPGTNIRCCCNARECLGSFAVDLHARLLALPYRTGDTIAIEEFEAGEVFLNGWDVRERAFKSNHRSVDFLSQFTQYQPVCWLPTNYLANLLKRKIPINHNRKEYA